MIFTCIIPLRDTNIANLMWLSKSTVYYTGALPAARRPLLAAVSHGLHEQTFEVLFRTHEFVQLRFTQNLLQLWLVLLLQVQPSLLKLQLPVSIEVRIRAIIMRIEAAAQLPEIMPIAIIDRPKLLRLLRCEFQPVCDKGYTHGLNLFLGGRLLCIQPHSQHQ